jgi:hypothetical protein
LKPTHRYVQFLWVLVVFAAVGACSRSEPTPTTSPTLEASPTLMPTSTPEPAGTPLPRITIVPSATRFQPTVMDNDSVVTQSAVDTEQTLSTPTPPLTPTAGGAKPTDTPTLNATPTLPQSPLPTPTLPGSPLATQSSMESPLSPPPTNTPPSNTATPTVATAAEAGTETATATPTTTGGSPATVTPTHTSEPPFTEGDWHFENLFTYFDEDHLEFYVQGEVFNDTQEYMSITSLWPFILDDAGEPVTSEADVSAISKDYAELRKIVRLAPAQGLAFSFLVDVPSDISVEDNFDFVFVAELADEGREDLDIVEDDYDESDWPNSLYVYGVYDNSGANLSTTVAIVVTLYGDYDEVLGVGWSYESGGDFLEAGEHDFELKVQMWEGLGDLRLELFWYKVQVFGY